jgi:hypothetical protein
MFCSFEGIVIMIHYKEKVKGGYIWCALLSSHTTSAGTASLSRVDRKQDKHGGLETHLPVAARSLLPQLDSIHLHDGSVRLVVVLAVICNELAPPTGCLDDKVLCRLVGPGLLVGTGAHALEVGAGSREGAEQPLATRQSQGALGLLAHGLGGGGARRHEPAHGEMEGFGDASDDGARNDDLQDPQGAVVRIGNGGAGFGEADNLVRRLRRCCGCWDAVGLGAVCSSRMQQGRGAQRFLDD